MPRKRTCRTAALCIRRMSYARRDGVTYQVPVPQTAPEAVFHASLKSFSTRKRESSAHPMKFTQSDTALYTAAATSRPRPGSRPEIEKTIEQCAPSPHCTTPSTCGEFAPARKYYPTSHTSRYSTPHSTRPSGLRPTYALPHAISEQYQIRQYGFHGISHQYVAMRAAEMLGSPLKALKLITCHLGNGCSITAIENGKSIDTSMGFTPLQGLVMGTRSGDIDPAIILYLIREHQMTPDQIDQMLNHQSGLIGVSGIGSDLRDLIAVYKENRRAALAIDIFCYRIRQYIGNTRRYSTG